MDNITNKSSIENNYTDNEIKKIMDNPINTISSEEREEIENLDYDSLKKGDKPINDIPSVEPEEIEKSRDDIIKTIDDKDGLFFEDRYGVSGPFLHRAQAVGYDDFSNPIFPEDDHYKNEDDAYKKFVAQKEEIERNLIQKSNVDNFENAGDIKESYSNSSLNEISGEYINNYKKK